MSAAATTRPTGKKSKDTVLAGAREVARAALGDEPVGEYLGFELDAERLGTHYFASTAPGYRGWHWYVTVSRIPRSRTATVCESGLLPGKESLLAPAWLPWADRLAPGDVSATDRLPYVADDDRLEAGWLAGTGDAETDRLALRELGLGRERVMNRAAIDAAATRWYEGGRGPDTPGSKAAGAACATCGFVVPLAGSLGNLFGVCANQWSPDDGKVVSLDHGCGAHSETDVQQQGHEWEQSDLQVDEFDVDVLPEEESAGQGSSGQGQADSKQNDGASGQGKDSSDQEETPKAPSGEDSSPQH